MLADQHEDVHPLYMDSIPRNEEQEYHKLKLYTNSATLVGAFFCYTGAQRQATSKKLRAGWCLFFKQYGCIIMPATRRRGSGRAFFFIG
jgi:hypothetical protein